MTDSSTAAIPGLGLAPSFHTPLFVPDYPPMQGDGWVVQRGGMVLSRGYWSGLWLVEGLAALVRLEPEGPRSWMSITPMELESQEIGIAAACGHTVVMGLGMGWAAANTALNPRVGRVTVVERDPAVIALEREIGVFRQLPPDAAAKLTVVEGDALTWRGAADFLMPDIWRPLNGPGREEEVRRMVENTGAAGVYFWGQEMELARRARTLGQSLEEPKAAIALHAIAADWRLPLAGPGLSGYAGKVAAAARQWLRD
ncbi:hypothetical protein [Rhodocista pekingensis]|uniref:Spermidine synthase n=1 Tax=Rhodocista pekingensis TaxID=201185 RepID=A0ABW2KZG4_9PROT